MVWGRRAVRWPCALLYGRQWIEIEGEPDPGLPARPGPLRRSPIAPKNPKIKNPTRRLLDCSVSLDRIQALLGHKRVVVTQRYAKTRPTPWHDAMAQLNPKAS